MTCIPSRNAGPLIESNSLVVEDDVRPPDNLRRYSDGRDIFIFLWVPAEFVIVPFLRENNSHIYILWHFYFTFDIGLVSHGVLLA